MLLLLLSLAVRCLQTKTKEIWLNRLLQPVTSGAEQRLGYLLCSLLSVSCYLFFNPLPGGNKDNKDPVIGTERTGGRSVTFLVLLNKTALLFNKTAIFKGRGGKKITYLANFSSIFSLLRSSASFFISSSCSFWRTFCSSWPCFLLCISLSNSSFCSRSLRSACFTRISSSSLEKKNPTRCPFALFRPCVRSISVTRWAIKEIKEFSVSCKYQITNGQKQQQGCVYGAFTDLLTCSSFSSSVKGVLALSPLSLPLPSPVTLEYLSVTN